MEPNKVKHLEFIQAVITRMNTNSFQIKGWCITIASALLAIYASNKNELFILIAIAPTFIFWLLDSYYLMQERKFRGLYKDIAGISTNPQQLKSFEMRPDLYIKGEYSFFNSFLSGTVATLYFPICLILGVLFYSLKY
ncbi:hypothetical protein [Photobacterium iliopiscarium]|uniref:hypothetical protein n=1 Tax=Photobacterium iliopiscarium TaxID=56192 RepID=UPI000AC41D6B|nr:hypothetical protein [Photobacterium iliopiscarium]PSU01298.1 hypothetical protein C9I85_03875 [Photobacterium iliopiscarium]